MEFISAFFLIFLAEMGDKTQLLALAFSTKFTVKQVLTGVMIGSFFNHGIAIALASFISSLASEGTIKIIASVMFLFFGLWSMKIEFEDEVDDENSRLKLGPIFTVAFAFFLGELGDKTQLTAMTLGLDSINPLITLLGTTTGMIAVSSIGILVGKLIGKKIPEVTMKLISSFVFLIFGITGLLGAVPQQLLTMSNLIFFTLILLSAILYLLRLNSINRGKYYGEKIQLALSKCKECDIHNPDCIIGKEIEAITNEYLGAKIPYLGKVIVYIEAFQVTSPKKSKYVQNCK